MKKLIFKNIFTDVIYFFLITSLSLTLVVWVIQAVNLLDLVSEDGHGFKLYFLYTLLILPKIFTKLIINQVISGINMKVLILSNTHFLVALFIIK